MAHRGGQHGPARFLDRLHVVDVWGWTARIMLKKGTTAQHAISQISAIESGLGLRPGSARVIPDPTRAGRFTLRVI